MTGVKPGPNITRFIPLKPKHSVKGGGERLKVY
jgi:hypothetical protein